MSSDITSRKWILGYALIVLIGVYRIYTESVTFDIFPFKLLIDQNYALIPYLLISSIVGLFLFTDFLSFKQYLDPNRVLRISVAGMIILSLCLVFIGTIPAIDESMDHDEATEAWNDALLSGQNPYDCANHKDYRVCELTALPGLALLSLPAFILGEVALLGVLAIALIISIFYYTSFSTEARIYAVFSLGISVPFYFRLLSQSNYFEIVALFLVGIVLLREDRLLLSGGVFGIVFATKTNAWPLLPVIAFHVFRTRKIRHFGRFIIPAVCIGTLLLLPFFLWNPYIFVNEAPLGVASGHIQLPIPYAKILFPLAVAFVSVATEYYTESLPAGILAGTSAVGLLFPKRYAVFFVVFLLFWLLMSKDDRSFTDRSSKPPS